MTASITVTAPVVAADGKTWTAILSGGTAPYSLSSISGIRPRITTSNGQTFPVASATVTGTTLTVVTLLPAGQGETVLLAIDTNGGLTDSASNSAVGSGGIATTNNSTVPVTTLLIQQMAAAGVDMNGVLQANTLLLDLYWTFPGSTGLGNYTFEFVSDATEVGVLTYSNGLPAFAVDAAAQTTPSKPVTFNSGDQWCTQPLTTAPLTAGKHLYRFTQQGYVVGVRISGGTRTVSSVSKTKSAIGPVTGATSLSATPLVKSYGQFSAPDAHGRTNTSPHEGMFIDAKFTGTGLEVACTAFNYWTVSVDGGFEGTLKGETDSTNDNSAAYANLVSYVAPGTHTAHCLNVGWGQNSFCSGVRIINGVALTAAAASGATSLTVDPANLATIAAGDWVSIDQHGKRECVQVQSILGSVLTLAAATPTTVAHAVGAPVTSFSAPAGSFTPGWQKWPLTQRWLLAGDSNTEGANALGFAATPDANGVYYGQYDIRTTGEWAVTTGLGYEVLNQGFQGTDTISRASQSSFYAAQCRTTIDGAIFWEGTNDINSGTTTPAQFQANMQTVLTNLTPILKPGAPVILIPCYTPNSVPGGTSTTSTKGLNTTVIVGIFYALQAANPTLNIQVVPNAGSGLVAADYTGVHYALTGQAKVGQQLVAPLTGIANPFALMS